MSVGDKKQQDKTNSLFFSSAKTIAFEPFKDGDEKLYESLPKKGLGASYKTDPTAVKRLAEELKSMGVLFLE